VPAERDSERLVNREVIGEEEDVPVSPKSGGNAENEGKKKQDG
jgi:hypothetical protein